MDHHTLLYLAGLGLPTHLKTDLPAAASKSQELASKMASLRRADPRLW